MKIYTKTGDEGQTSLLGGTRVSKGHERIEAYGTVDELNSWIGLLADQPINKNKPTLRSVQDLLFTVGATLATEPTKQNVVKPDVLPEDILLLEVEMDLMETTLTPLKNFILPGGHPSVSYAHLARTVCRRAERQVIRLNEHDQVDPLIIQYLNRLSDYLFVLGRLMAKELEVKEILWTPRKNKAN
jgi:cob(I)alamin adenosyltransferase